MLQRRSHRASIWFTRDGWHRRSDPGPAGCPGDRRGESRWLMRSSFPRRALRSGRPSRARSSTSTRSSSARAAVAEAVRRSGVDPALIDDVVLGESLYGGGDVARYAAIEAGLDHVAGLAHNRHCAAGLAAVTTAAATVRAGMDRVVVAGGVQSSSTSPRSMRRASRHRRLGRLVLAHPPRPAERTEHGHVDHRRLERRRRGRRHPRGDGRVGAPLAPARRRGHRQRELRRRDLPARGRAAATART